MVGSKYLHGSLAAAFALVTAVVSCSAPMPASGTNTNWVTCKVDADCVKAGAGKVCGDKGVCEAAAADGGSSTDALGQGGTHACTWPAALDGSSRDACHANK